MVMVKLKPLQKNKLFNAKRNKLANIYVRRFMSLKKMETPIESQTDTDRQFIRNKITTKIKVEKITRSNLVK